MIDCASGSSARSAGHGSTARPTAARASSSPFASAASARVAPVETARSGRLPRSALAEASNMRRSTAAGGCGSALSTTSLSFAVVTCQLLTRGYGSIPESPASLKQGALRAPRGRSPRLAELADEPGPVAEHLFVGEPEQRHAGPREPAPLDEVATLLARRPVIAAVDLDAEANLREVEIQDPLAPHAFAAKPPLQRPLAQPAQDRCELALGARRLLPPLARGELDSMRIPERSSSAGLAEHRAGLGIGPACSVRGRVAQAMSPGPLLRRCPTAARTPASSRRPARGTSGRRDRRTARRR